MADSPREALRGPSADIEDKAFERVEAKEFESHIIAPLEDFLPAPL